MIVDVCTCVTCPEVCCSWSVIGYGVLFWYVGDGQGWCAAIYGGNPSIVGTLFHKWGCCD
jgi:hypothetical protein